MLSKIKSKRECKIIEPLLWGYAAARLPEAESIKIQRHLNTCAECREQIKAYEQTVEGLSVLRSQPVPASLSNWQDVQRRMDAASPAPVPLSPIFSLRRAATGVALAGVACLLVGMVMAWKQGGPAVQDAGVVSVAKDQSGKKPVKKYGYFDKRLAFKPSKAAPFGKLKNRNIQGEGTDAVSRAIANVDMPTLIKSIRALGQNNRHKQHLVSGRRRHRKHHKHFRTSYYLVHRSKQKSSLLPPPQVAVVPPTMSASAPGIGVENIQPEYVLTTIVDSAPRPRDFVMDTMTTDSQKIGSNAYSYSSCNNADTADDKEIRGW